MRNDGKSVLKALIPVFAVVVICVGALWMADSEYNGVFKEWFYTKFIIDAQYRVDGKIGILFKSWSAVKQTIISVFCAAAVLMALYTFALTNIYTRYKNNKDIAYIKNTMITYMNSDSDELVMPKRFYELEIQLIKIKSAAQKGKQLMEAEMQRKNDLITYLAHDLKTPLASVIGYLSLLEEAPDMPAEQKAKYTGIALNKAYRLEELISEFFDITRFNLQSIVLSKGKIKLPFMLRQMADEFYPMLTPQGKKIEVNAPEDFVLVGDADKLARVFNNILKNAISYSYENSVIEISASRQDDKVAVVFTNQGDPIPAHKLETIFEKFYRLDSARSSNTGGAGLGMAIAKEIVSAHGGTITADSSPEHTVFTVKLPA